MNTQQQTDQARAQAASQALQARIRRENAAHDRRMDYLRGKTLRQIAAQQQQKKGAP